MLREMDLSLPAFGTKGYLRAQNLLIVIGASLLIALAAPIQFRLPFTPVPISLQPHIILFLSLILGSKRACMAVFAFLFQGAVGLPVFAGGSAGLLYLAGPTGGYLAGYALAAYATGMFKDKGIKYGSQAFCAMAVGNLVIYCGGVSWLAQFIGFKKAILLGVVPFMAGDIIKLFVFSTFFKRKKAAI